MRFSRNGSGGLRGPNPVRPVPSASAQPQLWQGEEWRAKAGLGIPRQSPAGVFRRQCLQPALLAASDNLVSRDSLVFLLNCVITLVRPLRGRQTGFPCLQVPATGRQLSARASSSSAPELLRSASAQGRQWEGRRGDKPPSPAGPVSGPGFLCCSLHTHRSSLNPRNSHKSRANSTCILQLT